MVINSKISVEAMIWYLDFNSNRNIENNSNLKNRFEYNIKVLA